MTQAFNTTTSMGRLTLNMLLSFAQFEREIIRLVVMMYVRYPLSLRKVEDLLAERGIDISYETVRFWWNRFGPMFAAEIRKKRVARMRGYPQWRWHLDEVVCEGQRQALLSLARRRS